MPWFVTDNDIKVLNQIMSATRALVEIADQDPSRLIHDTEKRTPMLVWKNKSSAWKLEFWTDQ